MAKRKPWQHWITEAESYGLLWCAGPGCPLGLTPTAHARGKVDNYGQLHWIGFSSKYSNSRGVRKFLMLVAQALNRPWRKEPYWKRLYLYHQWAARECQRKYHRRMIASHLEEDMAKAQRQMLRLGIVRSDMSDGCYLWYWRHGYAPYTRNANPKPFQAWTGRARRRGDMMDTSTL